MGSSPSTGDSIDIKMAQLLVRGLDAEVVRRLKLRAAENGSSAEEEHRRILAAALIDEPRRDFVEALLAMPLAGADEEFDRPRDYGRPLER
jgi:plasmid stability protein